MRKHAGFGWFLIGWTVLASSPGRAQPSADPLRQQVETILRTPGYQHAHWGILVVDRDSGRTVFELNADQLYRPASVTKLYSVASALVELGPDYRFQTPVYRRGEVDDQGVLHGDLVLVASGDPSLGGRTGPDGTLQFVDQDHSYSGGSFDAGLVSTDPLSGLDSLAREIQSAKIKAVTGDLIVDDRLFPPAPATGSGPSRVTPIVLNDNLIDVVVTPAGKEGEPATVRIVPETSYVSYDVQVVTGSSDSKPVLRVDPLAPRRFRVLGSLPVGHRAVVKTYEVEDPASFARSAFIEVLRRRGVHMAASPLGQNRIDSLPGPEVIARWPKLAEYTSPPFREYVKVILKVSQNLHASLLPLLLATRSGKTSLEAGLRREAEILQTLGVETRTIALGSGAGGSGSDLVTPRATVALLRALVKRPEFAAFEAGLPVLGRDGTLAKAVGPESPARGHVRAKTGTYWVDNPLDGKAILTSKALAGYLETASGQHLVFAFFLNNVPLDAEATNVSPATAAANRLLGRLCEVFYENSSPLAPAPTDRDAETSGRGS